MKSVTEKRQNPRLSVTIPVKMKFEHQELMCLMENFSMGGALLSLEESVESLEPLVGKILNLEVPSLPAPVHIRVLRLYGKWCKRVLAVQIEGQPHWKKFWFDLVKEDAFPQETS